MLYSASRIEDVSGSSVTRQGALKVRGTHLHLRPTQHVTLAMESGPASKAVHECLVEKVSLGAISVGAFVKLRGMATVATAMMGQADDLALGKLETT